MKKNLLSILILALLVVNIVMTAVMMINVVGTNQKTAQLINNIAMVMNLELYDPGATPEVQVPLSETETYDVAGEIMIPLSTVTTVNGDGTSSTSKQSYIVFSLSLLQNIEHEDYKEMGGAEQIAARESLIKDVVNQVVGAHTLEECQNDFDSIRAEVLAAIQQMYGSNFIYKIAISGVKFS